MSTFEKCQMNKKCWMVSLTVLCAAIDFSSMFHCLEWRGDDVIREGFPDKFVVTAFGRDLQGLTCSASFEHLPSFLVRLKGSDQGLHAALDAITEIFGDSVHESSGIVSGKPFTGWQDETSDFMRLVFTTRRAMKKAGAVFRNEVLFGPSLWRCPPRFSLTRRTYDTYELDADCVLEALTARGIPTTGWVSFRKSPVSHPLSFGSRCDLHFEETPTVVPEDETPARSAPHVVATFDIETMSSRSTWEDNIFPDATVKDDVVTMIVTYFSKFGENTPYDAHALVLLGPGGVAPDVGEVSVRRTVFVPFRRVSH
jgi:hypothetical protein